MIAERYLVPYFTRWETVYEIWWTSVANSSDKFEVGCLLKTNAVSAKGSCKLIYSMKCLVNRTKVAFQPSWNGG